MFVFGAGQLFAVPNSGSPAQPAQFGTLQDVSVNFSFTNKELYGQYQFPVAIGRGPGKVDGKASAASINAAAMNNIFFGGTTSTGGLQSVIEAGTVPGVSTYTVTVSHSATFTDDLGVQNATTGLYLTK